MPLTSLDPKTALVVIDLQKGIVGRYGPLSSEVVQQINELIDAFHEHALPVVLVNVAKGAPGRTEQSSSDKSRPADWAELVQELHRQPTDKLVTKHGWGALTNTDLHEYLQSQGVTQIVLTGISTSIGVESTARVAFQLGYNVTLATDAMTDMSAEAQANSLTRIFPRLGEMGTTAEILTLLQQIQ